MGRDPSGAPGFSYKKAGVLLLGLHPAECVQGLFNPADSQERIKLMEAVDAIKRRYGRNTLIFAAAAIRRLGSSAPIQSHLFALYDKLVRAAYCLIDHYRLALSRELFVKRHLPRWTNRFGYATLGELGAQGVQMLTRRNMMIAAAAAQASSLFALSSQSFAQDLAVEPDDESDFPQLQNPPIGAIDGPVPFGYKPATDEQKAKVKKIIDETKGATPYNVALSFVERFYNSDRDVISQWPAPSQWNPLIVRFFNDATSLKVNNDMVDWCAAFTNWCIWRATGNSGTNSAASQSFISKANSNKFKKIEKPDVGDYVVWTCYDEKTNKSLGIGHVGFCAKPPSSDHVLILSGNVAKDGRSSLICIKPYVLAERKVSRTVNGRRIPTIMKISAYLKMA